VAVFLGLVVAGTVLKGVDERRAADGRYARMYTVGPFLLLFSRRNVFVYARARAHVFCVYGCKTRPTVRLSGRPTRRENPRVCVQCVCGPGRRDAHARSSLSPCDRKYFVDTGERGGGGGGGGGDGGIGRRPRWEGMRGALRPSLRRMCGEGCEPDSRRRRSRLSRRTPHAADHPSSPKHHSTHHPAPVSFTATDALRVEKSRSPPDRTTHIMVRRTSPTRFQQ